MKRLIILLLIAVLLVGTISAQTRTDRQRERNTVTVDGVLKLEKGLVAVESGDNVYIVPMLTRYIGFINELKEGIRVSVEGYSFRNFIHPTKLTIEDKTHEFIAAGPRMNPGRQPGMQPGHRNFSPGRTQPEQNRRNFDNRNNTRPENRGNNRPNRRSMPDSCDCLTVS